MPLAGQFPSKSHEQRVAGKVNWKLKKKGIFGLWGQARIIRHPPDVLTSTVLPVMALMGGMARHVTLESAKPWVLRHGLTNSSESGAFFCFGLQSRSSIYWTSECCLWRL